MAGEVGQTRLPSAINKFPKTEERIEGRLVFLDQHGIIELDRPLLQKRTGLKFYRVKFFTGYRKFTVIDAVVGLSGDNEVFLLINPIFSDRYYNIIKLFERIQAVDVDQSVISEVVSLYKETGANVTEIGNLNSMSLN